MLAGKVGDHATPYVGRVVVAAGTMSDAARWATGLALCLFPTPASAAKLGALLVARVVPSALAGPLLTRAASRKSARRALTVCSLAQATVVLTLLAPDTPSVLQACVVMALVAAVLGDVVEELWVREIRAARLDPRSAWVRVPPWHTLTLRGAFVAVPLAVGIAAGPTGCWLALTGYFVAAASTAWVFLGRPRRGV
jgi:uncharacterized membrane protein